jgi:N-sulfoglucosamine sulfohydrolase
MRPRNKPTITIILLIFLSLIFNAGHAENKNKNAKNIVLILADDMGYHMSCVGTPGVKTPNIDALAQKGTLFTEAFSVCSSCSPSRSSILTGMYPHANGHWRNTFGPNLADPDEAFSRASKKADVVGVHDWVQTLPELMNDAGYYTAIMAKFHLSFPYKYPFSGRYPTKTNKEYYYKDITKIIDDAGDKPFFIQANISPPHRPFKKQANLYQREWPDKKELELFPYLPELEEVREDLLYYYVSVMLTDQITGRILDALKDAGKEKETLIIFTSDHGPAFHRSKASAYYAGSHVPLIFSGTNIKKDKTNDELVSLIDLLPTMFEYVKLLVPGQVQGKSLMPIVIDGKDQLQGRDYIFTTHNSHGPIYPEFYPSRAIYDGNFYLIKNLKPDKSYLLPADLYEGNAPWGNLSYPAIIKKKEKVPEYYKKIKELEENRPPYELYNMSLDPGQMNNVFGEPEYNEIQKKLLLKLQQWQEETGDTILNEMIKSFRIKKM